MHSYMHTMDLIYTCTKSLRTSYLFTCLRAEVIRMYVCNKAKSQLPMLQTYLIALFEPVLLP